MSKRTRRVGTAVSAIVLQVVLSSPAAAQEPRLSDLTLEQLMRIDIKRVFGASERLQPVTEAPSSVTIVTRDEIARYGYRTLADILRSVRGFYVSDDRNYSYVGARGFARPGDYNTRVLLLVNGHRVNDNVYDQASIGAEFGLNVAAIERVEVIRGPASALYGTSAFFAVVNVVTPTGASLNGAAVQVEGGSLGAALVRVVGGRRLASGVDFALGAGFDRSHGVGRLYVPAFDTPATNNGIAEDLDGERTSTLYGRVAFRDVTVTAMWGDRHKDVPTASFGTHFNAQNPAEHTSDLHAFVDARYDRAFGTTRIALRTAFDRGRYGGVYPYGSDEPEGRYVERDGYLGHRLTLAATASSTKLPRQTLTFGGEFIDNIKQNQWLDTEPAGANAFAIDASSTQRALFVQDEVKLGSWLLVNAGVRHDSYRSFSRLTPRGALIVMPSANQSFKYLYGRAFRAPNRYELEYYTPIAELSPETIDTHEFAWEQYAGEWLRTSVSSYWYDASKLITLVSVAPAGDEPEQFGFVNAADVIDARGLELEAEIRTKRGVQALGSYVWQRTRDHATGTTLTSSPRHQASARVSMPGPLTRSTIALDLRYLSDRRTLAGGAAAPHAVANATIVAPIGRTVALAGRVQNLFGTRFADPGSDEHVQDLIEQNGRTFLAGIRWTIGGR